MNKEEKIARKFLPLSAAQRGVWFAQQLVQESPLYNTGAYLEIHGAIDPMLFETVWRRIVAETEALHVTFANDSEVLQQIFDPSLDWPFPIIDLSAEADPRATAEAWMWEDLTQPVDLTQGPLFAHALFKITPNCFFLYNRYHHIIMDRWGTGLLARRLAEDYSALTVGESPTSEPFGDLALILQEEQAYRCSEQFAVDRDYWMKRLVDRPEPVSLAEGLAIASDRALTTDSASVLIHIRQPTSPWT